MKTCSALCMLLTIAGIASIHCGFAQQHSRVGVNVIMMPIQTIRLENLDDQAAPVEKKGNTSNTIDTQKIMSFGTAAHQVSVDREDRPRPDNEAAQAHSRLRELGRGSHTIQRQKQQDEYPTDKPLVFYSIRVN